MSASRRTQDWNPVSRVLSISDAWSEPGEEKAGEGQGVDQAVAAVPLSQLLPTTSVFSKPSQVGLSSLVSAVSENLVHFDFYNMIWHSSTSFRLGEVVLDILKR